MTGRRPPLRLATGTRVRATNWVPQNTTLPKRPATFSAPPTMLAASGCALLLAGNQACRMLYTGQGTQATIDTTAATYGASPQQAAALVGAARSTMCTQAPG